LRYYSEVLFFGGNFFPSRKEHHHHIAIAAAALSLPPPLHCRPARLWRQLGGGVAAAAAWRWQLGGGSLAVAAWQWRGGGGSAARWWRSQRRRDDEGRTGGATMKAEPAVQR